MSKDGGVVMLIQGWIRTAGAAVVTAAWAVSATADEIRIWPTATVTRDVVLLRDIAEVKGAYLESMSAGDVIIHVAPRPGAELLIRAVDIRDALGDASDAYGAATLIGSSTCRVSRPHLPELPKSIVIPERKPPVVREPKAETPVKRPSHVAKGIRKHDAESTRVAPKPKPEPRVETLESALREFIETHAPTHEGRIDIRMGNVNRDALALPQGPNQFDIQPDDPKPGESWLGAKSFRVNVTRENGEQTPVALVAEVSLIRPVVVARKPINRGQKIDSGMLRIEERRFDDEKKLGVGDIRAALGQTAAEFIDAGHMVMAKALAPAPVVKRGETVTIWRRGLVEIRLVGKAQSDGMLGSPIKVRREGSRLNSELLDAVVTGPGTVELMDDSQVAAR